MSSSGGNSKQRLGRNPFKKGSAAAAKVATQSKRPAKAHSKIQKSTVLRKAQVQKRPGTAGVTGRVTGRVTGSVIDTLIAAVRGLLEQMFVQMSAAVGRFAVNI